MNSIPMDMNSDLSKSLRDYDTGELQDAALALLTSIAESTDMEHAGRVDKHHGELSGNVCKVVQESVESPIEQIFLILATGLDCVFTAITALDKLAFMVELEEFGEGE